MSYILDALKKAEGIEGAGTPRLLSCHADAGSEPKRRMLWPYPVTAALLVNAGLILGLIYPRLPTESNMVAKAIVAPMEIDIAAPESGTRSEEENPSTEPAKNVSRERTQDKERDRRDRARKKQETRDTAKSAAHADMQQPRKSVVSVTSTSKETAYVPIQSQTNAEGRFRPTGEILRVDQLPPSVRSNLPAFKISGHAYSPEPSSRVVRINEQILQEGEDLAPGLKVEEITSGGVLLNYRGYRFHIGLNSN